MSNAIEALLTTFTSVFSSTISLLLCRPMNFMNMIANMIYENVQYMSICPLPQKLDKCFRCDIFSKITHLREKVWDGSLISPLNLFYLKLYVPVWAKCNNRKILPIDAWSVLYKQQFCTGVSDVPLPNEKDTAKSWKMGAVRRKLSTFNRGRAITWLQYRIS